MVAPVSDIKKLIVDLRNSSMMVCSFDSNYDTLYYFHNRKMSEVGDTSHKLFMQHHARKISFVIHLQTISISYIIFNEKNELRVN